MSKTIITDFWVQIAEPRLLQQYREAPLFCEFMKAYCRQMDEVMTVLNQIRELYDPTKATGYGLDCIGARLGLSRNGESDTTYRARLLNSHSYRANGTGERIIKILIELFGATSVEIKPEYPAGIVLFQDSSASQTVLDSIIGAGIRIATGYSLIDGENNNIIDGNGNYIYGL
jgi:hypothetical protein